MRHLLLRLVQPGEGAADTRRRVLLADLAPAGESVEGLQALLQPMVDERLLVVTTTDSNDKVTRRQSDKVTDFSEKITVSPLHPVTVSGPSVVEVAHEALIRAWPTLGQWIGEARGPGLPDPAGGGCQGVADPWREPRLLVGWPAVGEYRGMAGARAAAAQCV